MRQVACKIRLSDLTTGKFVKVEGDWEPNYIETPNNKKVSRANVIAVVASEPDAQSFVIDDGSAQVSVRSFETMKTNVNLGDVVLIIGRPRQFNEAIYIMPEIIKPVNNKLWIDHRKLELGTSPAVVEVAAEKTDLGPVDKLIEIIRELDTGEGADTEEVTSKSGIENADSMISSLLREGEIFEITSGKIKVLD